MHTREHDGEIEAPTLVPSHRHVKNGVTTGKIIRCRKSEKGAAEWKGAEAAEKQCKQSCEEAWINKENPRTKREKRLRRRSENSKKLGNRW